MTAVFHADMPGYILDGEENKVKPSSTEALGYMPGPILTVHISQHQLRIISPKTQLWGVRKDLRTHVSQFPNRSWPWLFQDITLHLHTLLLALRRVKWETAKFPWWLLLTQQTGYSRREGSWPSGLGGVQALLRFTASWGPVRGVGMFTLPQRPNSWRNCNSFHFPLLP